MRERIIWKKTATSQKYSGQKKNKKKKRKRKSKNWIRWIELRKLPIVQDVFLWFGTLYKVEGLNHYANLPTYGLRANQNCQFSI